MRSFLLGAATGLAGCAAVMVLMGATHPTTFLAVGLLGAAVAIALHGPPGG